MPFKGARRAIEDGRKNTETLRCGEDGALCGAVPCREDHEERYYSDALAQAWKCGFC